MPLELHEVSRLLGGLETALGNLAATVEEERDTAAAHRRDLRTVIGALSDSVRTLAHEVGEMKPAVRDYVENRAMAAGAAKLGRLPWTLAVTASAAFGALLTRLVDHWR